MTQTNALLLILTTVAVVTAESFNNYFGKKVIKTSTDITRFTFMSSIFSILTFLVVGMFTGGLQIPTLYTVGMGTLFGLVLTGFQLCLYRALKLGSFAYTTLFSSCGMLLSVGFGAVFYKESIDIFQVIGIVLILIMFYFNANPKKNENVSLKWLLFAIIVFFMNGGFGVVQKLFQECVPGDAQPQMAEFLIIAFFVLTVVSFITVSKNEKSVAKALKIDPKIIAIAAIVGIGTAINHRVNLYLVGVMDSVIFFPIANGACVIFCTLISALVFKEKYNAKQYVGLGLGVVAILLLSQVMNNFITI